MNEDFVYSQRHPALAAGEAILWRGKPKRGAFIATKSLTLLPIAVIWLILDLSIIGGVFQSGDMLFFMIPFFALHLMPVWIWLGSTLTAGKRWNNTNYYVTNRRIIIQGGFFAVNETSLFYKDLRNAQLASSRLFTMTGPIQMLIMWGCTIIILFLGGVQIFSLGIIGEYIGKLYSESKSRPRFIIERVLNQENND